MPIKYNIKTKIKINGKEYSGPDEMPPDVRQLYQQALAQAAASQSAAGPKIVFNGQAFNSVDDMPADIRGIYEGVVSAAHQDPDGMPAALQTAASSSTWPGRQPEVIQRERPNRILLLVVLAIVLLVILGTAAILMLMLH